MGTFGEGNLLMSHHLKRRYSGYASLSALLVLGTLACSFDDRDVQERPGIGDGDGDTTGDGDGDTFGDGDGDTTGDGDGDTTALEDACDYALVALAYLVEACAEAYFSEASCPGATDADIDALVACGDEAYLSTCEGATGEIPSETPTCDTLNTEGKIYILLAE